MARHTVRPAACARAKARLRGSPPPTHTSYLQPSLEEGSVGPSPLRPSALRCCLADCQLGQRIFRRLRLGGQHKLGLAVVNGLAAPTSGTGDGQVMHASTCRSPRTLPRTAAKASGLACIEDASRSRSTQRWMASRSSPAATSRARSYAARRASRRRWSARHRCASWYTVNSTSNRRMRRSRACAHRGHAC